MLQQQVTPEIKKSGFERQIKTQLSRAKTHKKGLL